MFITVRCNDDEKLLFNPNCYVANLLDNMRARFGIEGIDYFHLDLCDESGIAKDLPKYLQHNASKLLSNLTTYVLVERRQYMGAIPENESEERQIETIYTSLLKRANKLIPGFVPRAPVLRPQNPKELRKGKQGKDSKQKRASSPTMKSTVSKNQLKPGNTKNAKSSRNKK